MTSASRCRRMPPDRLATLTGPTLVRHPSASACGLRPWKAWTRTERHSPGSGFCLNPGSSTKRAKYNKEAEHLRLLLCYTPGMNKTATRRAKPSSRADQTSPQAEESAHGTQTRTPLLIAIVALVIMTLATLAVYLFGIFSSGRSDRNLVEFATESADNGGVVNSPLVITATLPWREGDPGSTVGSVSLLLIDEAGERARIGPDAPTALAMKPAIAMGTWVYRGSRSEERRVGKECRCWGSASHLQ